MLAKQKTYWLATIVHKTEPINVGETSPCFLGGNNAFQYAQGAALPERFWMVNLLALYEASWGGPVPLTFRATRCTASMFPNSKSYRPLSAIIGLLTWLPCRLQKLSWDCECNLLQLHSNTQVASICFNTVYKFLRGRELVWKPFILRITVSYLCSFVAFDTSVDSWGKMTLEKHFGFPKPKRIASDSRNSEICVSSSLWKVCSCINDTSKHQPLSAPFADATAQGWSVFCCRGQRFVSIG